MADRNTTQQTTTTRPQPRSTTTTTNNNNTSCASIFLRRLHESSPNSTQLLGVVTLVISGAMLVLLTGLTITAAISGFVFLAPLILLSIPVWFPIVTVFFVSVTGILSLCGFGIVTLVALSWLYRYFRGLHPPGSDRFDYARSRLASTAKEYGGFLHSKVKDAAPGA